jgi:hypothetical protein
MSAVRPGARTAVALTLAGAVTVALWAAACGSPADLTKALQVAEVSTGWFDAGIVDGKNKLVPSVSFVLKNTSDRPIASVQLSVAYWRAGDDGEWDDLYVANAIDSNGLAAGAQTGTITARGKVGYTGEQPRAEILQHQSFVDATARIFAKRGSSQWVKLGEFPIERRLLIR